MADVLELLESSAAVRGCDRPPGAASDADRLLTADQVAARWQVPASQVYRLAREGQIPTVAIGRYRRWRVIDLQAWEASGGFDGV